MYSIHDYVYYNNTIVIIVGIENDSLILKWFEKKYVRFKTVNKKEVKPLPNYLDYIAYSKEVGLLCDVGSPDTLEELMLNDSVQVLKESLEAKGLSDDTIVDIVYDIINKLENSFEYLEHCIFVEGYMAAVNSIKHLDSKTWKKIVIDVLQTTTRQ